MVLISSSTLSNSQILDFLTVELQQLANKMTIAGETVKFWEIVDRLEGMLRLLLAPLFYSF